MPAATSSKVWFITGASSGFGRAMAEYLLSKGDIVVATLRKPEAVSDLASKWPATKLLILRLDVSQPSQIAAAFSRAKETFGRVDVVFNNAGLAVIAEIEGTSDEAARRLFEVNFWGAANVSREAVKFFREVNKPSGGLLLQVSSAVGISGAPGVGYYSSSKFALEGFTEALQKEVDPAWKIKIVIVEPGPFRTKMVESNFSIEDPHPAYTGNPELGSAQVRKLFGGGLAGIDGDTDKAVRVIERLTSLENPPLRLPLHKYAVAAGREKASSLLGDVEKYESWSDDVYV